MVHTIGYKEPFQESSLSDIVKYTLLPTTSHFTIFDWSKENVPPFSHTKEKAAGQMPFVSPLNKTFFFFRPLKSFWRESEKISLTYLQYVEYVVMYGKGTYVLRTYGEYGRKKRDAKTDCVVPINLYENTSS